MIYLIRAVLILSVVGALAGCSRDVGQDENVTPFNEGYASADGYFAKGEGKKAGLLCMSDMPNYRGDDAQMYEQGCLSSAIDHGFAR